MKNWLYTNAFGDQVVCDCGFINKKPQNSTAKKHLRCKKCGKLINDRERFKEEMILKLGGLNREQSRS